MNSYSKKQHCPDTSATRFLLYLVLTAGAAYYFGLLLLQGSRDVCHRLNREERLLFEKACQKGFLVVRGVGWR